MGEKTKTMLFVCTGNTCRSPMAAVLAQDYVERRQADLRILSAGISAFPNAPASPQAREIMLELGLDLSAHRAHFLTEELWQTADLILTMTQGQKKYIEELFSQAQSEKQDKKVYLLKEYVLGAEKKEEANLDILDPFGQSPAIYRACATELSHYVPQAVERFWREVFALPIALGADHGGFKLKEEIKNWLEEKNYKYQDYGTFSPESCDYPDLALAVAEAVASGECTKGIIICGTGIGVSIVANKVPGIRAALCHDTFSAKASREHNDANILTLGERVIGRGLALEIVETWLGASFRGGRHQRRVDKIKALEAKED